MGLFIALVRKRELMKQKHAAEWRLTVLTQAKGVAQNAVNDLMQTGTDREADSEFARRLQNRKYELKVYEEKLDEEKAALETQLKEIDAEMQSCQSMIDSNIQSSFSYQIK